MTIRTKDRDNGDLDIASNTVGGEEVPVNLIANAAGVVIDPLTDAQLRATPVPVSGTFWQTTQPVSGPLTDAELRATAVPVSGPLTDAQLRANAVDVEPPPAPLSSYTQAGVITINTVLLTLDCSQHRSVSVQCVSMGTTGVVTPEWSNDNTTWVAATMFTAAGASATTFNAAGLWRLPVMARYLRLRLSTATTAGTTTLSVHRFESEMSPWLATQPVSGTVTANIGTGALAAGTNAIGDVGIQVRANATGAATAFNYASPATSAGTQVKTTAGRIFSVSLTNTAAAARYVKFFNVSTAPTMGTTAAAYEYAIPAGQSINIAIPQGIAHATGIFLAVTTAVGLTNNSTTAAANDVVGFLTFA